MSNRQLLALRHLVSGEELTNAWYQQINKVSKATATRDLQNTVVQGVVKATGRGAGAKYELVPLATEKKD